MVFAWIPRKDFTVGFAGALEVCRQGKGDCTEHGVLAVALLRRLGVPARGALGWVALDTILGLHFWVEVKLGQRWVPVDPTFDQAPASALRIKVGTTELSDMGSIGWDTAAVAFTGGTWVPKGPWAGALVVEGSRISGPGLPTLTLPGARWRLDEGVLTVEQEGARATVKATIRPSKAHLEGYRPYQNGLKGWFHARQQTLMVELGDGRWLQFQGFDLQAALKVLEGLKSTP